jgi:DEAD/DEAH box helicase domain-containing protein
MARNIVYFDLETLRSFQQVGGRGRAADLGVSVAVTYSTARGGYQIYLEQDVEKLVGELQRADLVVGYNVLAFDYKVLESYIALDLGQLPTCDLMVDVEKSLGRRVGLDAVAEATLGLNKTADGRDALKWWKEGRRREVAQYCCYDVKVTRLVHEHGAREGRVRVVSRETRQPVEIPVSWSLD